MSELIDWSAKLWDRQLLELKFHRDEAEAISRIPLSRRHTNDALFWLHSTEGVYSVKTGYHLARELKKEMDVLGEGSVPLGRCMVWGKLWKLHIPNKVRIFAWLACHDILPTRVKLARQRITEDDTCPLCKRAAETAIHAVWECSVAQDVWAGCVRQLQKSVGGQLDVLQLVEELLKKLTTEELELFFVQAWLIWSQQNTIIHGGSMQDPTRLNMRAIEFLEEFREAQQHLAVQTSIARDAQWSPLPENGYKLNFDAAIFEDLNATGFGAVIHNEKGEVLAALVARGPLVSDLEEAEVLACRKALEFAVDAGFAELLIEGDNVSVMRTISSAKPNGSRLGNLYGDIHCLCTGLRVVSAGWVSRTAKGVAHCLAKFARGLGDEIVWLEESPPPALDALYLDLVNV